MAIARFLVAAAAALSITAPVSGCAGSGPFALTATDNDPTAIEKIVTGLDAVQAGPQNKLGSPVAAVVTKTELALVDLARGAIVWKVPTTVSSRVAIGRDIVVAREGGKLVARDIASGKVAWSKDVGGELVGVDADDKGVYAVSKAGRRWSLRAWSQAGGDRFSASSGGALGAPTAARGIVFVPFLNQWLSILDAGKGKSLTRIRAVEEQISFVRADRGEVFFGSKNGVYLFDVRAASGSRAQSTFGAATTPAVFADLTYERDAYDVKQADYTAFDQRQLLWSASGQGGALMFGAGTVTVHYYRFLFGIESGNGKIAWAYTHPKVDLVAARDLGGTVVAIAKDGALIALDATTGALLETKAIAGLEGVRGATFDARGFRPPGAGEPADTASALARIAFDRDSRFLRIKKLAIEALAAERSPEATGALIEIARGGDRDLAEVAAGHLVSRADPSGADALVAEVEKAGCVALCARALAAIDPAALPVPVKTRAEAALLSLFESPATTDVDLAGVAVALGRLATPRAIAAMRRFFLVHRADPSVAENLPAVAAITDALAAAGGEGRAAVVFAADDPVTAEAIATDARRALVK